MSIQEHTPTARVMEFGIGAASPIDLLAIGFSRRESDAAKAEETARNILKRFHSIGGLIHMSTLDIKDLTGLEEFEALRVQALMELGRRTAHAGKGEFDVMNCEEDVARLLGHLQKEKQEHFCVVLLDAQSQVIRWSTIHKGTLTMSVVGPREVFREAIREGASSIIVAHNHPSGDPTPSPEDIQVTEKLVEIGKMLDIPVVDHVIIGDTKRATSLRKRGHIK